MTDEKIRALVELLGEDTAARMLTNHTDPVVRGAWKSYQGRHTFKDAAGFRVAFKAAGPPAPGAAMDAQLQAALAELRAVMGDAQLATWLREQAQAMAAAQKPATTKAAQLARARARSAAIDDIVRRAGQ